MWEYAVLHPPSESNGNKYCVVHAEARGEVTVYVTLECNKKIRLEEDRQFSPQISHVRGNKCRLNYRVREWGSLSPVFRLEERDDYPHSLIKKKEVQNRHFNAEIIDWEYVFKGDVVQPLYAGEDVMRVLSAAGLDSWELVGFVPDSTKLRMLRRKTLP